MSEADTMKWKNLQSSYQTLFQERPTRYLEGGDLQLSGNGGSPEHLIDS